MSTEKEKDKKDISNTKQKLFFDTKGKEYLEFILEKETTCQNIYEAHKEEIIYLIKSLNKDLPEDFDLDFELEEENYFFSFTYKKDEEKGNEEEKKISKKLNIKLDLCDKVYYIFSKNSDAILCFLKRNKSKIKLRKNARSLFVLEKDIYEHTQDSNLQKNNTLKANNSNEKIKKFNIYLFEEKAKNFVKKEITIDLEKITFTKQNIYIYNNSIKNLKYFLYDSEDFKKSKIKGDKMFGYIIIDTNNNETYLLGLKKSDYYNVLNSIKICKNDYDLSIADLKIDNDIYSSNSSLFAIYHLIIDNCFLIKEILSNNEKRKIFKETFPDKRIGNIIDLIIDYKSLNKKKEYLESWTIFKQILKYMEPYNDKDKKGNDNSKDELLNVLNKVNLKKYEEVLNKTNNALTETMANKNNSFNLQFNLNKALEELLKDNLFDELFFYLFQMFIMPFFENIIKDLKEGESPESKSSIKKKFQLLLSYYYFQFFHFNYYYLGEKENSRTVSLLHNK
jgi:hypothetical protein